MLCQPKLPGGASGCATEVLKMRVMMLREYRVSDRPLSFRPSGSEWRNLFGGSVVNVGEIPGKAGNDIGECLRRRSK